ncbi:hypothetical protein AST00_10740 [Staphylococcus equorum]|uniref:hypothetical protein n=1 Tax=Staphylococcus equorum TaxID=246432 RepID=UPI000852B082|nr:hypothetical protein [Staphylococcus equorum]OEK64380.1 hypothetical protein AST00_10740 [Staphylococcus equorum]
MEIKAERFFHTKSIGVIKVGKSKYVKNFTKFGHGHYSIELTSNIEKAEEFNNTPHGTTPIEELTTEVLKYTDGELIEIEYFGIVEREK